MILLKSGAKLGLSEQLMADDDEERPPSLKVVSDNPNAHADREIRSAKEDARRSFSRFAAALLRTMAGSDSEASNLIRYLSQFIESQRKLDAVAGRGSTIVELEEAIQLPHADMDLSDDWGERRWMRERGYELVVQGALRLAAHKLLEEPPHFGGKYSERVIERGVGLLEDLKRPNTRPTTPARQKRPSTDISKIDLSPYSPVEPAPQAFSNSLSGKRGRRSFGSDELKELKKAIRAKDQKRIAELTAKIGKLNDD